MDIDVLRTQLESDWVIDEVYSDEIELCKNSGRPSYICGEEGILELQAHNRYQQLCNMGNFENNLTAICLWLGIFEGQRRKAERIRKRILIAKNELDAKQISYEEFTKKAWTLVDFKSNGTAEGKIVVYQNTIASIEEEGEEMEYTYIAYVLNGKRIYLDMIYSNDERYQRLLYSKIAYALVLIPIFTKFLEEYLLDADIVTKLQLICFGLTGAVHIINDVQSIQNTDETQNFIPSLKWIDGPYNSLGGCNIIRTVMDEGATLNQFGDHWWSKMHILEESGKYILEYRKGVQEMYFQNRYIDIYKHTEINEKLVKWEDALLIELKPEINLSFLEELKNNKQPEKKQSIIQRILLWFKKTI